MKLVGSVATEEEKDEMEYITKIFLVSIKIKELGQKARAAK